MKSFLTAIRESQTRLIMSQLPINNLGEQKSEEDLGKACIQEKRDSEAGEDVTHRVHKKPRKLERHYCCSCRQENKVFGKDYTCTACGHSRCAVCLAGRSA
jgi:hypothetical protein